MDLPISVIIPTRNRAFTLERTLLSLAEQSVQPSELILIDGSTDKETYQLVEKISTKLKFPIVYKYAETLGAAAQRTQGMKYATQDVIALMDDDIIFESSCIERLWCALQSDEDIGGINAMITNQKYLSPGYISRNLFRLLHGQLVQSYAGKCIGPALNLLPEDTPSLPYIVPVEWLNTTCVLYRRQALPQPLFPNFFTGYSLMEDLTLSLKVGQQWKLANARTARIFHDSQPGDHKNKVGVLSKMELVNRHFVMTHMLGRKNFSDYYRLVILQLFFIVASLTTLKGWLQLPKVLLGKFQGIIEILRFRTSKMSIEEWN